MTTFDHRSGSHVDVGSARIYVEVHGDRSAPALVFLHGGLGTIQDFDRSLPLLEGRFRVIGIDSRGHGASTLGKEPLTYAQLASDVRAVVDRLEVARFGIVGFSDGGITGLRLAASDSGVADRIEKLVAIGTHAEFDEANRALYEKVTAKSWREKFPETYERYQGLNPAPDFDALVTAAKKMWLDGGSEGYPKKTVETIACPLLVARGDEDHLVSRAAVCSLAEKVKDAKLLVIPFATHTVQDDQPELLMRVVNQFLR